eukprot:gene4172-6441_t
MAAAEQATSDRVMDGRGNSKVSERRERQFDEFLRGGKGLRELRAMKEVGLRFLKERHADEWAKAKDDCLRHKEYDTVARTAGGEAEHALRVPVHEVPAGYQAQRQHAGVLSSTSSTSSSATVTRNTASTRTTKQTMSTRDAEVLPLQPAPGDGCMTPLSQPPPAHDPAVSPPPDQGDLPQSRVRKKVTISTAVPDA